MDDITPTERMRRVIVLMESAQAPNVSAGIAAGLDESMARNDPAAVMTNSSEVRRQLAVFRQLEALQPAPRWARRQLPPVSPSNDDLADIEDYSRYRTNRAAAAAAAARIAPYLDHMQARFPGQDCLPITQVKPDSEYMFEGLFGWLLTGKRRR